VASVSTREVDDLVATLGSQNRVSKSQMSRIGADIDIQVETFLSGLWSSTATPSSTDG